ncbi:MAG: hypothetical protein HOH18_08440 [Kordiimonadaceae bacterium]|nr:hypothetical protein [Kordiimonadaceae bacterium]MBT6036487.1 hypothetical protein [Kordiimonadaceae bacterium]MBT7582808.1 hypothetical protein [Kordiimonadaceae bacterium]
MIFDTSKIYYFVGGGMEKVTQALIDGGHSIEKVFYKPTSGSSKSDASLNIANIYNIPIQAINHRSELIALGTELKGKFCFSAGFSFLFPKEFLNATGLCVNIHGAILPDYPGARTLNWVLENGETQSGITIHIIDEGIDTGDIILQETFPISVFDTPRSLAAKTQALEPALVLKALALLNSGEAQPIKQENINFNDRRLENRTPKHSQLDIDYSLSELYNQIRAADPENYPSYFYINGQKILLKISRENKSENEPFSDLMI